VVSRTGGLPELITNKDTGFIFENGNEEELADIIKNLNQYDLKKIGEKAHEISRDLNVNNHLVKILEIYNKLLKN